MLSKVASHFFTPWDYLRVKTVFFYDWYNLLFKWKKTRERSHQMQLIARALNDKTKLYLQLVANLKELFSSDIQAEETFQAYQKILALLFQFTTPAKIKWKTYVALSNKTDSSVLNENVVTVELNNNCNWC